MNMRRAAVASTITRRLGSQRLKADEECIGGNFSAGRDTETFPEKRSQVSIHGNGSFEGLGCVLANTNLNILTAVFYWFTLTCDEPYIFPHIGSSDIRQLKTSHLLAPIKKVDASGKHDVAQRLQQRVTAIMRYAVQNDYIEVIWLVPYQQPKHDTILLYPLAVSLNFLLVLPHIVAV